MLRTKWVSGAAAALAVLILAAGSAIARPLSVEIWTDRGDDAVYNPGDAMKVKARANDDAYLLIYEIDSEGAVHVLFPFRRAAGMVEGKSTLNLPPDDSTFELAVESATGLGYIVAIASRTPFGELPWYLRQYDPQAESVGYEDRHDDVEGFDEQGRVMGDPTVAIERIRVAVLGPEATTEDFATSYATYYVGHEVRYPRYLCNDCHQPSHWGWWDGFDPYYTTCSVIDFRVNWNWCWGPCMWSAHTPYYYYVVRPDCPPAYYPYYTNNARWSSWGGRPQWNDLWGGPLTRYKSPPPPGYQPPPTKVGDYPRTTPPGWIATATKTAGAGYMPVGRSGEKTSPGGSGYRPPAGTTPQKTTGKSGGVTPSEKGRGKNSPQFAPPKSTTPSGGERPKSDQPKSSQPKGDEQKNASPKSDQPRYDQPKSATPKSGAPGYSQPKGVGPRGQNSYRSLPGRYQPSAYQPSAYRARPEQAYRQQPYRQQPSQQQAYQRQAYQSQPRSAAQPKYEQPREQPSQSASQPSRQYSPPPARYSPPSQGAPQHGQGSPGGQRTKGR